MASEIKVQRGVKAILDTGGTETGFTAVSALTSAFESNSSNQLKVGGEDAGSSTWAIDDLSGTIALTGTGTLTFDRQSGSTTNNMRFAWELIEYIGASSGDNEFIVRSRNTVTLAGVDESTGNTLSTSASNIDKCIPFITGVKSSVTAAGEDHATCAAFIDASGDLTVYRGGTTGTTVVQVVTVEFTGANWEVYHAALGGQTADTGTLTLNTASIGTGGSTGDVTNWSTAAIFGYNRTNGESISSVCPVYKQGSGTTTVDWAFHTDQSASSIHVVHVLRHPNMDVQILTSTDNTSGAVNVTIPSTLSDIVQAMVIGKFTCSGTGDAIPVGFSNYRITSTSNVEHWGSVTQNTVSHYIQVVDFSGITSSSDVNVTAITDALVLTENTASIGTDVNVTATTDALVLTENTASITIGLEVSNPWFTDWWQAPFWRDLWWKAADIDVVCAVDVLILTANTASIVYDVDVITTTDTLVLTENAASIAYGTNVAGITDALVLTENTASIAYDVAIQAITYALVLTANTATIGTVAPAIPIVVGCGRLPLRFRLRFH